VERSSGAAPPRRLRASDRSSANGDLLRVEIRGAGKKLSIVSLAGELDLSTIPRLEGCLFDELSSRAGVVVDLTGLSFIDSSGIGLLIKAHQATDGTATLHTVLSRGSQVERVFDLVGIGRAMALFFDRETAIVALEQPGAKDGRRA